MFLGEYIQVLSFTEDLNKSVDVLITLDCNNKMYHNAFFLLELIYIYIYTLAIFSKKIDKFYMRQLWENHASPRISTMSVTQLS